MKNFMKKRAFTLTEVLIALVVIGIIASLTIPATVNKSSGQERVAKLQKAYNTWIAAIQNAEAEHAPAHYWDTKLDTETFFSKYLKNNFDIMIDCKMTDNSQCFAKTGYKDLTGEPFHISEPGSLFNSGTNYKFITPDGISHSFYKHKGNVLIVWVDINARKAPNQVGRDVFQFYIFSDPDWTNCDKRGICNPRRGVKPSGYDSQDIDAECNQTNSTGQKCAAKVLVEEAMNY
ncbi:general secretion pathway protein GspI [Candidatus Gastranaerophilus sp. (ex Termes propinquus)]|nr:general secretion pathway protein GspI [Candidatus Gastranaerophilus sp. (ex Termes propinquus)]